MNAAHAEDCRLNPRRAILGASLVAALILGWSLPAAGADLADAAVQDVASGLNDIDPYFPDAVACS